MKDNTYLSISLKIFDEIRHKRSPLSEVEQMLVLFENRDRKIHALLKGINEFLFSFSFFFQLDFLLSFPFFVQFEFLFSFSFFIQFESLIKPIDKKLVNYNISSF